MTTPSESSESSAEEPSLLRILILGILGLLIVSALLMEGMEQLDALFISMGY